MSDLNFESALTEAMGTADAGGVDAGAAGGEPAATPSPGPMGDAGPGVSGTPAETHAAGEADTREPGTRARDDKGRFAPKSDATPAPKAQAKADPTPVPKAAEAVATQPPVAGTPTPTAAPKFKAPQAWKLELREKWGALPAEVQEEITRRELEMAGHLSRSKPASEFHQSFQQTVAPYEALMRAEAAATGRQYDPVATVGNLLQTAVALRTAPPQTKGALVANIIRTYGVPEEAIVAALQGQAQQAQQQYAPQQQAQFRDPRLDALLHQAQAQQQQRQHSEIEAFAAKHEFLDDVKDEMADLLEVSERRGRPMTLDQAYERATAMHPEVSKVLGQRKAAEDAKAAAANVGRARAAAVSVKSQPAGVTRPNGNKGKSWESAVEEAIAQREGR